MSKLLSINMPRKMKKNSKRRIEYDIAYMNMAEAFGNLSQAVRNKVGCIIVSENDQIIGQGFNGTPTGYDNCCEDPHCSCKYVRGCAVTEKPIDEQMSVEFCTNVLKPLGHANDKKGYSCHYLTLTTKPEVLHAETNAISKCAKFTTSTNNSTLYVTLSPCFDCAKIIIQCGIKRVVFKELYRNTDGLEILNNCNVIVEQLDIENKKLIPYN